jgi:hypothetical protein
VRSITALLALVRDPPAMLLTPRQLSCSVVFSSSVVPWSLAGFCVCVRSMSDRCIGKAALPRWRYAIQIRGRADDSGEQLAVTLQHEFMT